MRKEVYARKGGWKDSLHWLICMLNVVLLGLHVRCLSIWSSITFAAGLVDEGRRFFALMRLSLSWVEHYNCIIDLLGACTKCSDYITAEHITKKMIELEPNFHLSYVLLGNIYSWTNIHEHVLFGSYFRKSFTLTQ